MTYDLTTAIVPKTSYERGQEYYRQGGKVFGKYGSFSIEFLSGYNFEERLSRAGYDRLSWNKQGNYRRL